MALGRSIQVSPRLLGIPCWLIPICASFSWLGCLLTMLIVWNTKGSPHYREMQRTQSFAYISDVGASEWGKPIFITGSAITVTLLSIAFAAERWLRSKGFLLHASGTWSTAYSISATIFTSLGAAGLLLLTIFDAKNYVQIHEPCIGLFIGGYLIAATFMALEKRLAAREHPSNPLIRASYLTKALFALLEGGLTVIFGVTAYFALPDISVVFEWVIALFFSFYLLSFGFDFLLVPEVFMRGNAALAQGTNGAPWGVEDRVDEGVELEQMSSRARINRAAVARMAMTRRMLGR